MEGPALTFMALQLAIVDFFEFSKKKKKKKFNIKYIFFSIFFIGTFSSREQLNQVSNDDDTLP